MSSKRIIWFLAAGGLVVAFLLWRADEPAAAPENLPAPTPPAALKTAPAALPPVVIPAEPPPPATPAAGPQAVATPAPIEPPRPLAPGVMPIQNQKTIDFTSGRGVVKNEAADQAALEAGLKEIEEATKGVTFGPNGGPVMTK